MNIALIALGANIDGKANLARAMQKLDSHPQMDVLAESNLYVGPSIGPDGKPDGNPAFYNMAAKLATTLALDELRTALRQIEAEMGRVRTADKFAPRPIDLDIEFYGQGTPAAEVDFVSNPQAVTHAHVALPLADIAPDWVHPGTEFTRREVAQRLIQSEVEKSEL